MADTRHIHGAGILDAHYGERAVNLSRLDALDLPVPAALALPPERVKALAEGAEFTKTEQDFVAAHPVSLRSSPQKSVWGGAASIHFLGVTEDSVAGNPEAADRYATLVQGFAIVAEGLDAEDFEDAASLKEVLAIYEDEVGEPFPQTAEAQLRAAIKAMLSRWESTSARMLRMAKGAPEDAGLGLVMQRSMAAALGGEVQMIAPLTGEHLLNGALTGPGGDLKADALPDTIRHRLEEVDQATSERYGDHFCFDILVEDDRLWLINMAPAKRGPRAVIRTLVDLAKAGRISKAEAIQRADIQSLLAHLHRSIAPEARRDPISRGLGASPGAASGPIVFSAEAAIAAHAGGNPAILVKTETSSTDVRGMHAAAGVLTAKGGMSGHAAVIARGLGLPCVVGAGHLVIDEAKRVMTTRDGRAFREGDIITIDGSSGDVLAGDVPMLQAEMGGALATLLDWADQTRDIKIRANADTPDDARVARDFRVDGIGLCRTEHMFFTEGRLSVMRAMILATDEAERNKALASLLPMQREDFIELFEIMAGLPVTIRLLDPPLHEFLPRGEAEFNWLGRRLGEDPEVLRDRAETMREVNPMLGKRGVRVGVTMPEIYAMQARAIFEAANEISKRGMKAVVPEIMIPLVSAHREVDLVSSWIEKIAGEVEAEYGEVPEYRLGVMLETPRAALRAGDLADSCAFLSFGTNDLTQMTYGLSRDDAGSFMRDYVNLGVYDEDPFLRLDEHGVGELLTLATERGRERNPNLSLGICGEHGGDPQSIRFCRKIGLDYVSCSPYRVAVARLAAAQAALGDDA
ncbi:putative PEP-binding protein [Paracoccaceae bacterium GXU_MW_L88]